MKLKEIYDIIDGVAPFSLSEEFVKGCDGYDNSGVIVGFDDDIDGALFCLDCSRAAAERAIATGARLIVTHHPAIYSPIKSLQKNDPVLTCARAGISVISAHLNLDFAEGGIDDMLCQGLGGKAEDRMITLSSGGYGSVFCLNKPLSSAEFISHIKEAFHTRRVLSYGERPVKKIASFCGAGMEEKSIDFAVRAGADTFVSADGKHHHILSLIERNMNVVLMTHYASENYGFYKFYQKIKEKLTGVRMEYFTDERLL